MNSIRPRFKFPLIVASLFVLAGTTDAANTSTDSVDGPKVYHLKCVACHGLDGKGNPPMIKLMKARNPKRFDLTTGELQEKPIAELLKSVKFGKPGMPPHKDYLSDAEIAGAVAYALTLSSATPSTQKTP
jgi:mono/diheme cytochrome c family protein